MSGASISNARILDFKKSDDEIRQAVADFKGRLDEHEKRISVLAAWAANFERVGFLRRLRWLIRGR